MKTSLLILALSLLTLSAKANSEPFTAAQKLTILGSLIGSERVSEETKSAFAGLVEGKTVITKFSCDYIGRSLRYECLITTNAASIAVVGFVNMDMMVSSAELQN